MRTDWRRHALQLPCVGEISEAAVRAAYWRMIAARGSAADGQSLREAKRQLLFELGVRPPASIRKRRGSSANSVVE